MTKARIDNRPKSYWQEYYIKNKDKIKAQRERNKDRILQYRKEYWSKNKEKEKEKRANGYWKEYYLKNKDRYKEYKEKTRDYQEAYRKEYYAKHKEKEKADNRVWFKNNRDIANAFNAKRKSAKLNRTPKWLTIEDFDKIKDMYKQAFLLSSTTNTLWHVDHIIPLQGKLVSGLHVPSNLQIIPAVENLSKNNKYRIADV